MNNSFLAAAQMRSIFEGFDFGQESNKIEVFSNAYLEAHVKNILRQALDQAMCWNNQLSYNLLSEDTLYFGYDLDDPRIIEAQSKIAQKLQSLGYEVDVFFDEVNCSALITISW